MVFSCYKKQRIIFFHSQGHKAPTIAKLLEEEGLKQGKQTGDRQVSNTVTLTFKEILVGYSSSLCRCLLQAIGESVNP